MATRRVVTAWAAGLAMVASLVAAPAATAKGRPSGAAEVACGAVVTTDVRLTRDLSCAGDAGLTVRGDVTIDLGGHRFAGPGVDSGSTAILVEASHDLVLRNGTITGWGTGMTGAGESDDRPSAIVRDVVFLGNGGGIMHLFESDVARSRFQGNGSGVWVWPGTARIDRTVFVDNGTAAGGGDATGVWISRSTLERNDIAVECSQALCEIDRSRIQDNRVGLNVWFSRGGVTGNTFLGNDVGAELTYEARMVLERNTFADNRAGIQSRVMDSSVVRDNTFRRNGIGFLVADEEGTPEPRTTVTGNRFSHNGDGILAEMPRARFGNNVAMNNTGWGIYAPGAEDLGGNVARNNGNEPQCVGVVC